MTSDEIAAIRARINLVPWDNGIGCTLDGITYYAHGRSDDQDQALITTLSRLKSDVPALLDLLEAAQAEVARLRAALDHIHSGASAVIAACEAYGDTDDLHLWQEVEDEARAAADGATACPSRIQTSNRSSDASG